jgi:RNA polymerase sigma factor (sigma-70 family)
MTERSATVFLVDDDPSVRKALARALRAAGYVVELFASAREFQLQYRPGTPGCLVLDVELPGLSGLELQEQAAAQEYYLPIVFISAHGDIPMSVRAMRAGAVDFLTKPLEAETLLSAVERALACDQKARKNWHEVRQLHDRIETLTEREREVFALVVTGMLNKQIAAELGTSEKTVKVHRRRVMDKMAAESLADLVRLADRAGIGAAPVLAGPY